MNKLMAYLPAGLVFITFLLSCRQTDEPEYIVAAPGGGNSLVVTNEAENNLLELSPEQLTIEDSAWSVVGQLQLDGWPVTSLSATSGAGMLFVDTQQATRLALPLEHGNTVLTLEFVNGPEAVFGIYLQGGYRLDLQGPYGAGALYSGLPADGEMPEVYNPLLAAERSPGVWQRLQVFFQAPQFDENERKQASARIEKVYLNGQLVQYQRQLPALSPGAVSGEETRKGKLVLWSEQGQAAFRNIRYREQPPLFSHIGKDGVPVLAMPTVKYHYYEWEGTVDHLPDFSRLRPKESGQLSRFDLAGVRDRSEQYGVRYEAMLDIPADGSYTFFVTSDDGAKLYLDSQLLIDNDGLHGPEEKQARVQLTAGEYPLRLDFFQGGGGDHLSVSYLAPGGEKRYLNSTDPENAGWTPEDRQLEVRTDAEPYLLRSFVYFPPEQTADKRTHTLSVGEAEGPHYTVDLSDGSLLMSWNGGFVDAVDMWDNRGIQQVARPLGAVLAFSGDPQWAYLEQPEAAWPDTPAADAGFRHLRYELDDLGRPVFHYKYNNAHLSDQISPAENPHSLVRRLSAEGSSDDLYTLLARGTSVSRIGQGQYYVAGGDYLISVKEKRNMKIYIRQEGDFHAVVARITGSDAHLTYQIDW